MLRDNLILRTRLTPPRPHRHTLARPALTAKLREALEHRLTLVQAGTGSGKSTALAALAATLAAEHIPVFWYSLTEADADPQRFLAYLIAAFRLQLPQLSDLPQAVLQEVTQTGQPAALAEVVGALSNALAETLTAPALLLVDDFHFVLGAPEVVALAEHFIAHCPPDLHVLVASRTPLQSRALTAWRVRGEVLEINRNALAFQPTEVAALFRETYGMELQPPETAALLHYTEGWPMALQLVWQSLRANPAPNVAVLFQPGLENAPLNTLFDYLAQEVLERQPPEIAAFLLKTAALRELTPGACMAVTDAAAPQLLEQVHTLDLFIITLGDSPGHYRYHHLFHDFLRAQWAPDPSGWRAQHRRAAQYFHAQNEAEEALYHWLEAQASEEATAEIETLGEAALQAGRLDTVAQWMGALPPAAVAQHPLLQRYLGDLARLRSRFDEALAWYQQAEQTWRARGDNAGISRALRGQALVYLDTVRPAQAESLLEEALRLTDGVEDRETQARMLELLAENKLNIGKPAEAERLRAEARTLRAEGPGEDALSVRVKLRTGRLDEAQHILQSWVEAERGQVHPPRAHRETVLILSLIHGLRGEAEAAVHFAEEGLALGKALASPFVTAVAQMRLGHALQLTATGSNGQPPKATTWYEASLATSDQIAVRRTRAEALWGLTRAYGFGGGDLGAAQRAAAEGMEICRWAGDAWLGALVELTLSASYVLAGQAAEALEPLHRVLLAFRECGDPFGRAATRLWLSLAYAELKQMEHCHACVDDLLALCAAHHYDFLFTRPTFLGLPDPRRCIPLLLAARARRVQAAYVAQLLETLQLTAVQTHPGYQLRVQTLGNFRVWRGGEEIDGREWKRDKARQLFQLLVAERGRLLQREEITERLWPQLTPEAAARDFKVALNALYKVLEPARSVEAPSAYIVREGATYGLRLEADVWLDVAAFEKAAESGLRAEDAAQALPPLQAALQVYAGDFLPDALYEDWASVERERLLALWFRAADKLAGALLEQERSAESLALCQQLLDRDPCWERAYRLMMLAHARQGNRAQALRVYQRCVQTLRAELEVAPAPTTTALYETLAQSVE